MSQTTVGVLTCLVRTIRQLMKALENTMLCCLPGSPSACPHACLLTGPCTALLAVQPVPVRHVTESVGQGLVSGETFLSHCNSFCQPSGLCGNPCWG